jgi:hypothetical protein
MKTKSKILLASLALGASAWMLTAQIPPLGHHRPPPPGGPDFDGERPPPPPPIIAALDANHDGVIDAKEIANASKSLLELDEDGDGRLTREELRPPPPSEEFNGPPPGPPPAER